MKKFNFYLGASVSAWLLAVLVIVAELAEPFKALLKTTFGHHWTAKAVIITLAFLAFGYLLGERKRVGKFSDDSAAWYSMLGSLAVIFLFYVIEFFV